MTPKNDRLPPQNREAEEAVLGSLLIDPDAILEVAHILRPPMFYVQVNQWAYEAMLSLHNRNEPIDTLTLINELSPRNIEDVEAFVIGLTSAVPTSIHVVSYANLVKKCAIERAALNYMSAFANKIYSGEDTGEGLTEHIKNITKLMNLGGGSGLDNVGDIAAKLLEYAERSFDKNDSYSIVFPSFLPDLSRMLKGGYRRGRYYIFGARPGMGKTAIILQEYFNFIRFGHRAVFFTLEMSNTDLMARMISQLSGIDSEALSEGELQDEQWAIFHKKVNILQEKHGYFADKSRNIDQIVNEATKLYANGGIDVVFIDYIQLVTGAKSGNNRNYELEEISRKLKQLSIELDCVVIAAAQLNRGVESRTDKRPMMSDLKDSGSLEQDADAVMFLYREDYYEPEGAAEPGISEINTAKNRRGNTGVIKALWKGECTRFESLQKGGIQ